jgi:hypothetical protein
MSTEETPKESLDPAPAAPYTVADGTAAASFIDHELVRAKNSLNITRIISLLLVLSALFETFYVVGNLQTYLEPKTAADMVQGVVSQHLDDESDNIREGMVQRIPQLIAQIPDQVIQQMPSFRESLETKFTTDLGSFANSSSQNLNTQLTDYLSSHKDEVKQALTDSNDTATIHALGTGLTQQFMQTLQTTSDGGETLQQKLNTSLTRIQQVKQKMDYLAADKNLSPQDKQTRHMIALMVRTASLHAPKVNVTQAVASAQAATATAM